MNKLYYIVCDDKDNNVFEGRYQGRTRGEALKFRKQSLGRKSLNGLVFTITEIPVPLIREIVAEILAGGSVPVSPAPNIVPIRQPEPESPVGRFDAFADAAEATVTPAEAEPADEPAPAPAPTKKSKPSRMLDPRSAIPATAMTSGRRHGRSGTNAAASSRPPRSSGFHPTRSRPAPAAKAGTINRCRHEPTRMDSKTRRWCHHLPPQRPDRLHGGPCQPLRHHHLDSARHCDAGRLEA
jgi:hypothetical protein